MSATGLDEKEAVEYLNKTNNNAALAVLMWKLNIEFDEAREVMNKAKGEFKTRFTEKDK